MYGSPRKQMHLAAADGMGEFLFPVPLSALALHVPPSLPTPPPSFPVEGSAWTESYRGVSQKKGGLFQAERAE